MHWNRNLDIPLYFYYVLGIFSIWKMLFLFKDFEFNITFILSCKCFIFVGLHCFYLVFIKKELHKTSAIETIYNLSVFMMLVLPLLIIVDQEFQFIWIANIPRILATSMVLAVMKFLSLCCAFWLIKQTDPLTFVLTHNVGFIAEHIVQALVYKFDCTVSATKICFLIAFDFLITLFRDYSSYQYEETFG